MFTGSHFSTDADTTTSTSFEIFEGTSALTMATANRFAGSAHAAVAKRGVFSVALSGGTTPKNLYALMAAGLVQLLAPVLPSMARARTAYVMPGVRFVSTIRRACVERHASVQVLPPSTLACT